MRFFQRCGVGPSTAISAGVIDSVSGFIVQFVLFVLLFFASDVDLGLSTDTEELSGLATIALIVIAVLVVAGIIVAFVARVRRRVLAVYRAATRLPVLRSPRKLLQLFGGNLPPRSCSPSPSAAASRRSACTVPLTELVLINTVVSLFAGLLPVPGGIGVTEAGLTLGLTAAGVPSEIAFAVALSYRFASFYLPPIWGWFCYRWLISKRYL